MLSPGENGDRNQPVPPLDDDGVSRHANGQVRGEQREAVLAGEKGEGQEFQVTHHGSDSV